MPPIPSSTRVSSLKLWGKVLRSPYAHWSKGNVEEGFAAADRLFEHRFNAQLMHQGYMEPHACVVHIDDSGRAQVWANNKGPFMLRDQLAAVWDVPTAQIRVNPTRLMRFNRYASAREK